MQAGGQNSAEAWRPRGEACGELQQEALLVNSPVGPGRDPALEGGQAGLGRLLCQELGRGLTQALPSCAPTPL